MKIDLETKGKEKFFGEWVEKWLENKKHYIKESTYASYSIIIMNHIIPEMGDLKMKNINADLVQDFALNKIQNGRLDKTGGLSIKTVRDIIAVLKLCLKAGIRAKLINNQDFEIMFPKSNKNNKLKVFQKENQKKLQEIIRNNLNFKNFGILMCLYTGLRIGELCALKWGNIDIKNKVLVIDKTLQRVYIKDPSGTNYTKVIETLPKTVSSIREIPISSNLIGFLKEHKKQMQDEIYFLSGDENYIEPRIYRSYYNKLLKTNNIPHIHFHGLRHTFATRCIELGADYKTVSQLLGHANVNMTLNLYVHPQFEQKKRCIDKLAKFI